MRKHLLVITVLVLFAVAGFSQSDRFWSAATESRSTVIADKATSRLAFPKELKLFRLNFEPFKQQLSSIVDRKSSKRSTIISLPDAAGKLEEFEVYEASNFE